MNNEKSQKAMELFKQGYNCSQSVIGAWCEDLGLDFSAAVRLSQTFGGGMGRMREVCGACTGAFMVLGLKYGTDNPKDSGRKKQVYEIVQKFAKRFKEENGSDSIICRELLGLKGSSSPTPSKRTAEYYKKRPCVELVGLSAGLLGEFI
ncbi:MAG: C-GCAxxG-C-C family protein [Oscillospiraceae bacterium]